MVILVFGIIISVSLLIYFYICEIKASVFLRLGFRDSDVSLDEVNFSKYFSLKNLLK